MFVILDRLDRQIEEEMNNTKRLGSDDGKKCEWVSFGIQIWSKGTAGDLCTSQ